jgi:hypothetical protein
MEHHSSIIRQVVISAYRKKKENVFLFLGLGKGVCFRNLGLYGCCQLPLDAWCCGWLRRGLRETVVLGEDSPSLFLKRGC